MCRLVKVFTSVKAVRLVYVVTVFVVPHVHAPFTFADILDLALDALHEVYDKFGFAVHGVKDLVFPFGFSAGERVCVDELSTALAVTSGVTGAASAFSVVDRLSPKHLSVFQGLLTQDVP